jgi:DNA polymerase I-like protein with 3'-5' exonuclease and polymerase domains
LTSSNVILDEARLLEAVDYFRKQAGFAFDVESVGEHRGVAHLNDVTWLSMATDRACVVVPFGHNTGSKIVEWKITPRECADGKTRNYRSPVYDAPPRQIPRANVFEIIRPLFFDERIVKSAHGAVFDIASTAKYFGAVMPPPYNDTIIQSWLLDENRHRHGLKWLTKDLYGFYYDDEEVGRCIERHPFAKVAHYSYCDAVYAWLLYRRFAPLIEAEGLQPVYELEMDVLNVLVGMRLAGSHVDVARLKELKKELTERKRLVSDELMRRAGQVFNPNSTQQKQVILFGGPDEGGQGLKPWKPTATGKKQQKAGDECTAWSTDDEVLESYPTNPVASKLREYQETSKLLSTYVLAYLGNPAKDKGSLVYSERIHADFVQYGTTTRRFSCRDPNLQNIPRPDTDLGKLIRGVWLAEPGWKLVVADYSQIELVVFAHFAGHGALYDGFQHGLDPHQVTADRLHIPRQLGKTLNFSMSYGAGTKKVASMLGVEYEEAKAILRDHRAAFPEIYALKNEIIATCRSRTPPYVMTLLGGKRRLPEINVRPPRRAPEPEAERINGIRWHAERQAVSAVIQGSAADLMKTAMVRADRLLAEAVPEAYLTLSVHDEVVVETPREYAGKVADVIHEAMVGPDIQRLICVPLSADIKIVDRWADAK